MDVQRKQQSDEARQQLDQQKITVGSQRDAAELALEREKLESRHQIDIAALSLEEAALKLKAEQDDQKFEASQELEGIKLGRDMAKDRDDE